MPLLWMLGRKVQKELKSIKNNDLNFECVTHITGIISVILIICLAIFLFVSILLFMDMNFPDDYQVYSFFVLTSLLGSYWIFRNYTSYLKEGLICHSYGKIYQGTAINFTRGVHAKPFIICEFSDKNSKRHVSYCTASPLMVKKYIKGQELLILYVEKGSAICILDKPQIPLYSLSNSRKKYLQSAFEEHFSDNSN